MNLYEFIASLVASLAWPITAVVIALVLRPTLSELAKRVRNVKYAGLEADLATLDRLSAAESAARPSEKTALPEVDPAITALVGSAPGPVVESAWRRVRDAVHRAAYILSNEKHLSQTDALEQLLRSGVITTRDLMIYNSLAAIRERVYYEGAELSPAVAIDFVDQADRIMQRVSAAVEPPLPED